MIKDQRIKITGWKIEGEYKERRIHQRPRKASQYTWRYQ